MKICFAAYEGVPLAKGGPYIKIIETKKHLEKLGCEVELFNMWSSVERINEFDIIHLVGSNLSVFGFARNLKYRNIKFLVEPVFYSNKKPSLIKSFSNFEKYGKKVISGFWSDYGIIKDICSWSDLILPNTSSERDLLSKAFSISLTKFKIIPNGVSERFLYGDPSIFINKYGIKDFILNVGHIGPQRKNILSLIKALEKINHPAVIIGKILNTGETEAVKKEAAKNKNLLLIEELPNDSEMLASAYAACDSFVMPSLFETPGIAALEAALAGAKIVITPFGGTKDYFKDMAEYVDPYSVELIQEGIEVSLNKNKDEKLKNFIKDNFLWEKIAQKSIDIYSNYLSK